MTLTVVFFRSDTGAVPVLEWLRSSCTKIERTIVGSDLRVVQERWPVGLPTCRGLGGGLYEVRSVLPTRIARLLFCFHDGLIVVLHGFIKKTRATPRSDLDLARARLRLLRKG